MLPCHRSPSHRCCHGPLVAALKVIWSDSHTETLPLCVPRTQVGMVPFLGTLGGRDRRCARRVVRRLLATPRSLPLWNYVPSSPGGFIMRTAFDPAIWRF